MRVAVADADRLKDLVGVLVCVHVLEVEDEALRVFVEECVIARDCVGVIVLDTLLTRDALAEPVTLSVASPVREVAWLPVSDAEHASVAVIELVTVPVHEDDNVAV